MPFQGIIFDFNGVLVWDRHLQEEAWEQFALEARGSPLTGEEIARHVHGRTNWAVVEYLTGHAVTGEEARQMGERREAIYRQLCRDQGDGFRLSPGAVDVLDFLTARRIPRAIATSAGKSNVDFFAERLHLDRWFDAPHIVWDDGSRPSKPAPDIYLEAARRLSLEPATCIVVEDAHSGIEAARRAGIGWIVALGPAETHPELARLPGVDAVIESLVGFPRGLLDHPQAGPRATTRS
jgi:HAD superfamily hydrolase (TIGR01509 family)